VKSPVRLMAKARSAVTYAAFRNGTRTYRGRPASKNRAARAAWDILAKEGEIVTLHLHDGYWCCQRPDGSWDDVENSLIRDSRRAG
jgi:hypothetical protein